MALSKEQFAELRSKGLTVQQIVDFENGKVPKAANKEQVKLWDTSGFTDAFKGIAKGAGKVALGVGTIGRTIQEGVARLGVQDLKENSVFDIGSTQRATADKALTGNTTAEKIASTITEIGATAVPSGAATKLTTGLGFARAMLGRGAIGGVIGTVQGGGDFDKDTAIGAASEIAFPVLGKTIKYGGSVLKGLAGMVSGKGSDVIEQVLKSPEAALAGGSAQGTEGLRETATAIREGVKTIRKKAGTEFETLVKPYTQPLGKNKLAEVAGSYLDDVNESSFIDTAKLDKLKKIVDTWEDTSPKGLNELASKISKFYSGSDATRDIDAVVTGLNRRIRDFVGEQIPDIATANAKYADKMDLIDQMDALFKARGSVDSREGLQKTAEAVARLFNANKDLAREGVEEIERELGIDILGKEAGRQLVDGVTRSQGAIGDFTTGVAKSLIPPKVILQITARTGIAKEAIESRLSTLEPIARASVIEVLTDLFGEGNQPSQQ